MISNIDDGFVKDGIGFEHPLNIYAREMRRIIEEEGERNFLNRTNRKGVHPRALKLQLSLFRRPLVRNKNKKEHTVFARIIRLSKKRIEKKEQIK